MIVRITNSGEGDTKIIRKITKSQYKFLNEIFKQLNENGGTYIPTIYTQEIHDDNNNWIKRFYKRRS